MLTKSILNATLTATAIALVAGLGSASAADQFTTIEARVMTDQELDSVVAGAGNLDRGSPNPNVGDPPWSALVKKGRVSPFLFEAGRSGIVVLIPR